MRDAGFRGWIGAASTDITPPVGIYARSWGAAEHEAAEGVHRELLLSATALTAGPHPLPLSQRPQAGTRLVPRSLHGRGELVLISADLGWWRDPADEQAYRQAVLDALGLAPEQLVVAFTHTHAGPSLSPADADKPGGHLIAPYLARLTQATIAVVREAQANAQPGVLEWTYGACTVAANRDLPETPGARYLAGWNPEVAADDTLLVGRATSDDGLPIATIVNYACHPTTLAWGNKKLSPDYIGALRETVQKEYPGPCLFLQGASGELAPREQYTADTAVADRHGVAIGYAVRGALAEMLPPGQALVFDGVVESGAPLAVWKSARAEYSSDLEARCVPVELPIKPEWRGETEDERRWAAAGDPASLERRARRRRLREALGGGETVTISLWAWRIGDALLFAHPNEAYSLLQTDLRKRFPDTPVAVINVANGWHGYLPPADRYDDDLYAVWCSPFDRGALEILIAAAANAIPAGP